MRKGIAALVLFLMASGVMGLENDEIKLSLDKLFSLKVTSVSGTAMDLKKSPAAIYVITSDDFKKQGHQTIADALRAVPGFHVSRIDSNKIAVTSRGFTGRFANKLLVLIDGRSVYTPLFAGVYWEIQDMVIEDIDRIEVIRGPGATLWGANAVNGVINIVTKNSRDTQSGYLRLGIGTHEQGYGDIRWGDQLADDLFYRLSFKGYNRAEYDFEGGGENNDSSESYQFNLRTDWFVTAKDTLTFIANVNNSIIGGVGTETSFRRTATVGANSFDFYSNDTVSSDTEWYNRNFQVEWNRALNATDGFTFKAYYDLTNNKNNIANEWRETIDFDFRHWFDWVGNNSFIWGLNYRTTEDELGNSDTVALLPKDRRINTYSGFIQNTHYFNNQWSLMLGSKIEHNDQTGFEIQPSARLTYEYSDDTVFWASISRSVRRPARTDDDLRLRIPALQAPAFLRAINPVLVGLTGATNDDYIVLTVNGDRDSRSEELVAWELGMRQDYLNKKLSFDLATFYFDYSHVSSFADTDGNQLTLERDDNGHAEAYGIEASVKYSPTEKLDMMLNYTWYKLNLHAPDEDSEDTQADHLLYSTISYKLTKNLSLFTTLYYSDNIPGLDVNSYITVDAGLNWRINDRMQLNIWGKNLTDPHQKQFFENTFQTTPSEVPRSFFAEFTYKF